MPSDRRPRRADALRRAREAVVDVSAIREDARFRRLWLGMVVSESGRQVMVLAMPYEVYVRTNSTLAVGLLAAVELTAILGLSLPAGALADALDRRRLLTATQGVMVACSIALAGTAAVPGSPLVLVYGAAFVLFAASALDRPARKAALFSIVDKRLLNSAVAVDQASIQIASVGGPAVAGFVISTAGLAAAFLLAAAGFGVMVLALLGLDTSISPAMAPMRRLQGIRDGLRFVRERPVILSTMAMDFTAMVFGYPSALFPALALTVFGVGASGLGLLASAPAMGALVSSFLSGSLTSMERKGVALVTLFGLWGVAITLFGVAAFILSFPLALLFLGMAGGFDIAAAVLRASIVQGNTPDEFRGRVVSINLLASQTGPRLGDLEATTVASVTSVAFSIVSGGVLCLLGIGLVAWRFPRLRGYVDVARRAHAEAVLPAAPAPPA
jgi:MFS family permease